MIKMQKKLFYIRFAILFSMLCVLCFLQYMRNDFIDYQPDRRNSHVFQKRHILSINENTSQIHNSTKHSLKCLRPDIEQFPKGFITQEQRIHGAVIIHLLVALYMFIGLAIVCDNYFVPSLEAMVQAFDLKDDVAGATFMAAGSSAPELATTIIALFIAKDVDIGIGTVVGSAVFNIMFVISIVALLSGVTITLNWYPIIRDSFCYLISILAMILCIIDDKVYWYEAFMLLILYVLYIIFMKFSSRIEAWLYMNFKFLNPQYSDSLNTSDGNDYKTLENDVKIEINNHTEKSNIVNGYQNEDNFIDNNINNLDYNNELPAEPLKTPFSYPSNENIFYKIYFLICFPLNFAIYYTIPNLKIDFWKRFFPLTFLISLIWLVIFSYIIVWMITVIGYTFHIPDTIMGLTFIAFGASIPDGISSFIVAKHGHGNMAVSNAIGSNVFDILICLGIPWFIGCLSINKTGVINVRSRGLTYSTLTLFGTVLVLILTLHLNKWKLDRKLGVVLMIIYILFVILASMYELNILGANHLPMCLDSLW